MIVDSGNVSRPQTPPDDAHSEFWEFYQDRFDQWQWRKFEGKKVVAVSADGFYSRQACVNNARTRGYAGS